MTSRIFHSFWSFCGMCWQWQYKNNIIAFKLLKLFISFSSTVINFYLFLSGSKHCTAWRGEVGGMSGFTTPLETLSLWGVDTLPCSHCPGQQQWRHRYTHTYSLFYCEWKRPLRVHENGGGLEMTALWGFVNKLAQECLVSYFFSTLTWFNISQRKDLTHTQKKITIISLVVLEFSFKVSSFYHS